MPYRVLTGLSYPPDKRAEIGDVVDDLPPKSVKWLLEQGHIVDDKAPAPEPTPEPTPDPAPEPDPAPVADGSDG